MFLIIFSVFAVPYVLKSKSGKIAAVTSRFAIILRKADVKNLGNFLKRLYFGFRNLDSSKLLHAYVLCALLMVSLSFAVGPDPRVKVYVLSSTQGNAAFIADFLNENGAFSITIFDEMSEFELLSDLGVFSAVVVGDFYPPTEGLVKNYIYPAFDVVPQIIVVKDYAFESFVNEVVRRYGEKTVVVNGLADLSRILVTLDKRANPLCLEIPLWVYMGVSGFVGLCSLLIVFLGFTFLASKLLEIGKKPGVGGFAEAIAYAFFLFFFTQMIYIVCSVLLAMPLGLHTSSPKVTAIGFMGFGGGSRPRMFAGLAGVLFGAFASLKEGLKLSREGLAVFVILFLFILIDPLTHGVVFYEFVLLYTAGPMYETAFAAWTSVRTFLSFIGFSFGGLVSPIYGLSTGIILYYAGAIPIVLFSKLEKGTATVFLFICAFWAASGGIRVADMMPWKSVASSIPGIVVGLFFSAIFWLISLAEKLIKAQLGRVY
ncbi:MAG: hypothetical protein QXH37_06750 [Candidatus Bathyarchaeia archaeon]